jgi:hypothetical protein
MHNTDDPVKMWDTLRENVDTTTFIGRVAIGTKFVPHVLSRERAISVYIILNEALRTHVYTTHQPILRLLLQSSKRPLNSPSETDQRREPVGSSHGFKVGKRSLHP